MAKKQEPFHNPFKSLKLSEPQKATPAAKGSLAPPPAPKKAKREDVDEDAQLFLDAMAGTERIERKVERVDPVKRAEVVATTASATNASATNEDAESLARLAELVATPTQFETDADGAGWVRGFDPGVIRRLRAGDFSPGAQLDLHGLTQDEAASRVDMFIRKSRTAGLRCVLIITGRGLHSSGQEPVLKSLVPRVLTTGYCSRNVLSFVPARAHDGGGGALYVLLRR